MGAMSVRLGLIFLCLVVWSLPNFGEAKPLESAGGTDRGVVRPQNEDNYLDAKAAGIYAVADGMGGHAAGEVASRMAISVVQQAVNSPIWDVLTPYWPAANTAIVISKYHLANAMIFQDSMRTTAHRGMGNTLVTLVDHPQWVDVINVGDSRGYLIRDHHIVQITHDQSLVQQYIDEGRLKTQEEIERFPYKNIITQAMGTQQSIAPVVTRHTPRSGDIILLCSDGLTNELTDAQILGIIETSPTIDEAVTRLIEDAKKAGGRDNITVVIVRY